MPDCPYEVIHVWEWFQVLNRKRQTGLASSGIPETEIEAFCRLRHIQPLWWELAALELLDAVYLTPERDKESTNGH
jgi:hypothetical protein